MKLLQTLAISVFAILACISCMNKSVLSIEGIEADNILVLHAIATPDSTLDAVIMQGDYVLYGSSYDKLYYNKRMYHKDASVLAYVNGNPDPIVFTTRYDITQPDETDIYRGLYESSYIPEEGDEITIVAHFPGYPSIEATQTVPKRPELEVKYRSEEYTDGTTRVYLNVAIKDKSDEANYYRFTMPSDGYGKYFFQRELIGDFYNTDQTLQYISDIYDFGGFDGKEQSFSYYSDFRFYSGEDKKVEEMVQSISYDTYEYLRTKNLKEPNIFGEVRKVHSNVNGGAGIFVALSSVKIDITL